MIKTYIDPPQGHRYGFPKVLPDDVTDTCAWLVTQGYPQSLIDEMGDSFYCRFWQEVEDESQFR
jgi:hypothetical protein